MTFLIIQKQIRNAHTLWFKYSYKLSMFFISELIYFLFFQGEIQNDLVKTILTHNLFL